MGKKLYFLVLTAIVLVILFAGQPYLTEGAEQINQADTAWMLVASAFVLFMTPGLAFFYGGMVNKKNIISTMLQSFVALGVVSLLWVLVGFSLCFGDSYYGIIGDPRTFFARARHLQQSVSLCGPERRHLRDRRDHAGQRWPDLGARSTARPSRNKSRICVRLR